MKKNGMLDQLRGWVEKEIQLGALPPLPTLIMMLLPESPTKRDIVNLYLNAQEGVAPSMTDACPVYRMASKFRGCKDLFLALLVYRDEPEVRKAISEERARAHFSKGMLVKKEGGTWPKGSAVTDAMKAAQRRMVEEAKVSAEASAAAKDLRNRAIEKLAEIDRTMECTAALEKVAEYDSMLQSLLSDSGKLKHKLMDPSLPKHPSFSFAGGRGPNQAAPSEVSATISE